MTADVELLPPAGWNTEDHLTDKSATTYSPVVRDRWLAKGWPVWPLYTADQVRANVIHHTAPLRYALDNAARDIKALRGVRDAQAAAIEALRAEVRTLVRQNGEWQARVKPAEPRRIWVNTYGNRMGFAYASREQADANADAGIYRVECVEFVEVVK